MQVQVVVLVPSLHLIVPAVGRVQLAIAPVALQLTFEVPPAGQVAVQPTPRSGVNGPMSTGRCPVWGACPV
jgi:hypothetical protein